jgi:hypothetical protein
MFSEFSSFDFVATFDYSNIHSTTMTTAIAAPAASATAATTTSTATHNTTQTLPTRTAVRRVETITANPTPRSYVTLSLITILLLLLL